ncbi:MAG: hypothetical protein K0Q72_616 [Armatimonadetes bacterium]|jgi:hypothetical protein|nr:hypothetical protein [Armatimonadota bacterium]
MLKQLAAAVTVSLICVSAASSRPASLREEFTAILRRYDECFNRKDLAGAAQFLASDFMGEDIQGNRFNRKEAEATGRRTLATAQTVHTSTRLIEVRLVNGEAVVVAGEHTELKIRGTKTGILHTALFDGTWRSVWVKRGGRWLQRSQKQLSLTITRDGVPEVIRPKSAG